MNAEATCNQSGASHISHVIWDKASMRGFPEFRGTENHGKSRNHGITENHGKSRKSRKSRTKISTMDRMRHGTCNLENQKKIISNHWLRIFLSASNVCSPSHVCSCPFAMSFLNDTAFLPPDFPQMSSPSDTGSDMQQVEPPVPGDGAGENANKKAKKRKWTRGGNQTLTNKPCSTRVLWKSLMWCRAYSCPIKHEEKSSAEKHVQIAKHKLNVIFFNFFVLEFSNFSFNEKNTIFYKLFFWWDSL